MLQTPRLALRQLTIDDAAKLYELDHERDVLQYIDRHMPSSSQVIDEVKACLAEYEAYPGYGRFLAEDQDGQFLGWFSLKVNDGVKAAPGLGYRLRRSAWGRGIATEGGRALICHAFTQLLVDKVEAQTMFVNYRSRWVMEKCGLRYAHTRHLHFDDPLPGTEHGEVWYEITRQAWRSSRQ